MNHVNYRVAVQTPEYRIHSLDTLLNTPIAGGLGQLQQAYQW